jgi:hypothetical protein
VVADAPYADLHNPIANRMREGHYPLPALGSRIIVVAASLRARTWLLSPISRVAQVAPRGLLVIAPSADELIDHAQALRLFAAARDPKELYVVEGAGHSAAREIGGDAYVRRVLEFLGRHLNGHHPDGRTSPRPERSTSVGGAAGHAL